MSTGLRRGDTGPAVAEVRARLAHLGLCPDRRPAIRSTFDDELDRAVRAFQQERGITVDGVVGPQTFRRLEEARWQLGDRVLSYSPGHLMAGDDVTELQRRLNQLGFAAGRADGLFGVQTDAALREFQKGVGVTADGTCGPDTFRAFDRLVRTDLRRQRRHAARARDARPSCRPASPTRSSSSTRATTVGRRPLPRDRRRGSRAAWPPSAPRCC